MFTLHVTGLDASLDEYRRAHADLADFLVKIAYQELTTYDFLTSATVAYIPQSNVLMFAVHRFPALLLTTC